MNTETQKVDARTKAYLSELAADIAAHGGFKEGQSIEQAMREAHARRQSFAMEMAHGQTERAKKARRIFAAQVYGDLIVRKEIEQIAIENDEVYRVRLVSEGHAALARVGGAE